MAGIYIHIPFCKQACHYCDFHFSTNVTKQRQLINAIGQELLAQQNYLGEEEISTIYFGGGTPSLLSSGEVIQVLNVLKDNYDVNPSTEITLEANPDDLTAEKLSDLKSVGINRLSIGIQSFDDTVLRFLNRAHNSDLAMRSFEYARKLGFDNISVDLMYAIPGQDLKAWEKNIDHLIALAPEHISTYSLTIEEKTVFGKWAAEKIINPRDNDDSATDLLLLIDKLEGAGYHHYEVSNFSKPGYISKHNSGYWKDEKYLGVGPSAHSYNGTERQYNVSNNHLYINSIEAGQIPATIEILTREDKINECLLTGLRTSWGTNLQTLLKNHQYDLLRIHSRYIQRLIDSNYALISDESLVLTKKGRLLADKIASDLFTMAYS